MGCENSGLWIEIKNAEKAGGLDTAAACNAAGNHKIGCIFL